MVISPAGQFLYRAVVPPHSGGASFTCIASSDDDSILARSDKDVARLVGLEPTLAVSDGGVTPQPTATRPLVERARITLSATTRQSALAAAFACHVDQVLVDSLAPGDVIRVARTGCAGLGLSVTRSGELIAAIGAVTAVPLSEAVSARCPGDLIARAEAVFQERDATFRLNRYPIEVQVDRQITLVVTSGRQRLGRYEVFAIDGFAPGMPGENESLAIVKIGACPLDAAVASAYLLRHTSEQSIVRWTD